MSIQVTGLYVYPIKACRGIALQSASLVARGLEFDRRWMIVDSAGKFVTQREVPKLALVHTALLPGLLGVSAPGLSPLELPLAHEDGERAQVSVWGHQGSAVVHAEGSRFFSQYLGAPHRLVYMPDDHLRAVNPARARPGDIVSFADGYPLLLISEASLTALNERLTTPISMERFRPNVVISGTEPFAEDHFQHFSIGEIRFRGVKRCDRCAVTTVDLETGERGREPLATLATFRKEDGKVWFGMNVIHDSTGMLSVADEVTVSSPT